MTQGIYRIKENSRLNDLIYKMVLLGDTSAIQKPGQFINIKLDGFFLRRPISICDYDDGSITIIYKTVGNGTQYMATLDEGEKLNVLCGLGNGFDAPKSGESPIIVGGGVGVPPLYHLTKKLVFSGKKPTVILGFNTANEMFYKSEFEDLGVRVLISTADGSLGTKGFVTDVIKTLKGYTYVYTCGPLPMLRAVYDITEVSGQYSFEERMGCGFGACMGCSCKTKYGNKRICKEGPVLEREEIIW